MDWMRPYHASLSYPGCKTARGNKEKPDVKVTLLPSHELDDGQGPYRGFLLIKCECCGEVRAFCAKRETYSFRCRECGEETPLENLRPLFMECRCGQTSKYKTNITDRLVTHHCLNCKAPVDMMINRRETAFVTVGRRKDDD